MRNLSSSLLAVAALFLLVSCSGDETGTSGADTDTTQPDSDQVTGVQLEMVDIPAGEFWMGCNGAVDEWCEDDEYPYHAVMLSAYKIGKYEVTVGEYQKCVASGVCNNSGAILHYSADTENSSCHFGMVGKENYPMNCVTWYGAKAFCEWIGGRLPTEAEWEKAARGTDGRKYPWGNEEATCIYAVMSDSNAGGDGCGTNGPMPRGSISVGKSPYGAYDMAGNVWEWVSDWYAEDYYEETPTNNPMGPGSGEYRVMRGGAWDEDSSDEMRVSYRNYEYPSAYADNLGFRCAK